MREERPAWPCGVDPAFLLAAVSSFDARDPLPVAAHNVGHIRTSGGMPSLDGYRAYASWRAGIAAWYRLIRDQYAARRGLCCRRSTRAERGGGAWDISARHDRCTR